METIAFLIISLGVILIGAEVFVNGIEWLGKKLNLAEGAVGSVLAAVGTALPETLIPFIAIVFGNGKGSEIGIGAILGAPLMLSTLAMFVTGMAVIAFSRRRTSGTKVVADFSSMKRDLGFFIIVFTAAVLTGIIPPSLRHWQLIIAGFMVLSYIFYVYSTLVEERDINLDNKVPQLYFAPRSTSPAIILILLQITAALAFIIGGANMFVSSVTAIANVYSMPAFVLSLIIAPIATELPEKFNSIIWVSREKDTLALGNITGAMVFQSSLIPAMGIFLTKWQLTGGALTAALLALTSAAILYIELVTKKHITAWTLLGGGILYGVFLLAVFQGIIRQL
ncbi:MAG TPA: sodium:calcium antiporter [Syntrophomonadaceae bacterium]|nr:sodium:calcium antiporter [Syntrophomonadaceae bacterium]